MRLKLAPLDIVVLKAIDTAWIVAQHKSKERKEAGSKGNGSTGAGKR
jgi:hypothetical protein